MHCVSGTFFACERALDTENAYALAAGRNLHRGARLCGKKKNVSKITKKRVYITVSKFYFLIKNGGIIERITRFQAVNGVKM